MKFLLSIILWAIVPMLTPQGLQIGVVNINNKTIRIMKMNLNNPAFLQSASNVVGTPETRFVFVEGQNKVQLSANGSVVIESVQGGEKVIETYSALDNTTVTINADTGAEIVVYGAVTKITVYPPYPHNVFASLDLSKNTALTYLDCNGCTGLTSLDLSKNTALTSLYCSGCTGLTSLDLSKNTALTFLNCGGTPLTSLDLSKNTALTSLYCNGAPLTSLDLSENTALTYLDCSGCTGLTSLDLSKNTALTSLYCKDCTGLISLDVSKSTALTILDCPNCQNLLMLNIENTAELNSREILDQSMANLTTLQVAGTSAWAYEQVESWLSDFAPDGGMIYVDENTPQGVITEAQGKSWTVEHVDAA